MSQIGLPRIFQAQLQAQIDNYYDLLHARNELIPQISKRDTITAQDLFEFRPMTLRGNIFIPYFVAFSCKRLSLSLKALAVIFIWVIVHSVDANDSFTWQY